MTGYTKLFSSIITSTIWREPKETKVLWITMLALAGKDGHVAGSVPGLAHLAGLSIPETESALLTLSSPDPYSRTPEADGRRIIACEGGWNLVNHSKYRKMLNADERREYLRVKQAERREAMRQQVSTSVAGASTPSTHAEAEAEAELVLATPTIPSNDACPALIYAAYPRKVAKAEAIKAINVAIKALKAKHADPAAHLLERVTAYADAVATWPADRRQFIPHPATWIRQGRYEDDPAQWRGESTKPRSWQPDPNDPEAF
jgi:hypothetical protein